MKYTSRGLRRRGNTNKWHVTLSHRDPLTGELVPSYHTVEARTEKQAAKKRDELILDLERKGSAYTSRLTLAEFLEKFIQHKESSMTIEASTVNHYRKQARVICRYIGGYRLADVTMPDAGVSTVADHPPARSAHERLVPYDDMVRVFRERARTRNGTPNGIPADKPPRSPHHAVRTPSR